jgi:hypothetical protein
LNGFTSLSILPLTVESHKLLIRSTQAGRSPAAKNGYIRILGYGQAEVLLKGFGLGFAAAGGNHV